MKTFFRVCFLISLKSSLTSAQIGNEGKKEVTAKGIEYVWEAPVGAATKMLFLAHGCSHTARDFWPSNPKCQDCVGLPEERRIVKKALENSYFVFAITSLDQDRGGCWDPKYDVKRILRVTSMLKKAKTALRDLPVFALGASSGGNIVAALANRMQDLGGMCIQIMAPDISFQMNQMVFPPSFWIYMQKDSMTARRVADNMDKLRKSHALVESALAKQIPLSKSFFSNRITGMSPVVSEQIFDAFRTEGLITDVGYLRQDPRHSNWRLAIDHLKDALKPDSLIADQSPIAEELNVAYALHEITADFMDETLIFFDKAAELYKGRTHAHEH